MNRIDQVITAVNQLFGALSNTPIPYCESRSHGMTDGQSVRLDVEPTVGLATRY
jgi:hypothetical protein